MKPVTIRLAKYGAEGIYKRLHTVIYKEMVKLFNKGVAPIDAYHVVREVNKEVMKIMYYPGKY